MMDKESNSLSKFDKKWAKHLKKENQNFEDYFKGLYDDLYKRYEVEYSSIQDQEEKVKFLSELLDEIIEAKHNLEHNFTISPIVAKSIKKLNGLFKKFEYEIQDLTVFGEKNQIKRDSQLNRKMEVLISKFDDKLLSLEKKTEQSPRYIKKKNNKSAVGLRDFFAEKVSNETIAKLQAKFKNLRNKKLAILICLLDNKKMLEIDDNDRKRKSRLHFVRQFTGEELKHIKGVNNYLQLQPKATLGLKGIGNHDNQFKTIEKQLNEIVGNC